MKQHRKLACAALPLLVAGVLTTPARADGETLAVFTKNQTNPYFQTVRVGADVMAKALNAKTLHYIPTKPDSIPEQLSQIEDVVVKKPSAIVFIPVDYKAMVPGVEKINAAKIPVVNITDRSAGGKFVVIRRRRRLQPGPRNRAPSAQDARRKRQRRHHRGRQGVADQCRPRPGLQRRVERELGRQAVGVPARQLPAPAGTAGDGKPDAVQFADRRGTRRQ